MTVLSVESTSFLVRGIKLGHEKSTEPCLAKVFDSGLEVKIMQLGRKSKALRMVAVDCKFFDVTNGYLYHPIEE